MGLVLLKRVPIWAWVILAALAWGGWQRHQAKSIERKHTQAVAEAAAQREAKLEADAAETVRRLEAQKEITDEARKQAKALASDVERSRAAADRLRARLAAIQADAGANNPPTASGSATDGIAEVLGQCVERYRDVAAKADAAVIAGLACQRSYEALSKP